MLSGHTYMSYEAHAWSLFGSIQALHPTCPGIVLNPRQRHIAHPSQDRDPATNVSISILPLGDYPRKGFGEGKTHGHGSVESRRVENS